MVPKLTVAELAGLASTGAAAEELSAAAGTPLAVVDLGLDHPGAGAIGPSLASLPCVLVGVGESVPGGVSPVLDVVLDDAGDALGAIAAIVDANPLAAVALVLLLRGGATRTLEEGLVAESSTYSLLQAGPEFARWRSGRPVKTVGPQSGPAVLAERLGNQLRVTLNRPARHNAFSAQMRDELAAALGVAVADPDLHVVLDGNGPSFCSGGDLDEFGSFPNPAQSHVIRLTRSPARLMAALGERVEVHLHGACVGAGIELPAFADRVVAAPDTLISLPEVTLGLVPGAGGTASLPRRIGRQRTAELALSGIRMDARTALAWGLVDEIADT
jgi:hypothetical protein